MAAEKPSENWKEMRFFWRNMHTFSRSMAQEALASGIISRLFKTMKYYHNLLKQTNWGKQVRSDFSDFHTFQISMRQLFSPKFCVFGAIILFQSSHKDLDWTEEGQAKMLISSPKQILLKDQKNAEENWKPFFALALGASQSRQIFFLFYSKTSLCQPRVNSTTKEFAVLSLTEQLPKQFSGYNPCVHQTSFYPAQHQVQYDSVQQPPYLGLVMQLELLSDTGPSLRHIFRSSWKPELNSGKPLFALGNLAMLHRVSSIYRTSNQTTYAQGFRFLSFERQIWLKLFSHLALSRLKVNINFPRKLFHFLLVLIRPPLNK